MKRSFAEFVGATAAGENQMETFSRHHDAQAISASHGYVQTELNRNKSGKISRGR